MRELTDFTTGAYTVLVASDHGGFASKNALCQYLEASGIAFEDVGPHQLDPDDDYPDFANQVARRISFGDAECGILICTTGIGMCINANRFPYVRAAQAETCERARISRDHNCANILVTGGLEAAALCELVTTWLQTPYSGAARHSRRLGKIETGSFDTLTPVREVDPVIAGLIDDEIKRQESVIELIASENITSPAVQAAVGSCLTNKYAEGYPRKRYYDGCEFVDEVEQLAIDRACDLFGAEAANVQPHSGSQANMAVFFALLEPGARVLSMDLAHGGHLTHGLKVNFSGRLFDFVTYGVDPQTEQLNYDTIEALAREHRPQMLLAGASAYSRFFDFERLREIADAVGALFVFDMAHIAGLVAAGQHPNPVPFADAVTTTTHKTLRGPRAGMILCREAYLKRINSQIFPGIQGGPLMHVIAGKAICLKEAKSESFRAYQAQVVANAKVMAAELAQRGFRLVSGGTDNHLMLVDLRPLQTTGKAAAAALDEAGITVNKNLIPFDPEKPVVTSGLRIGTPTVTTRGMKEPQMRQIAGLVERIVRAPEDAATIAAVRDEVTALTRAFPIAKL